MIININILLLLIIINNNNIKNNKIRILKFTWK